MLDLGEQLQKIKGFTNAARRTNFIGAGVLIGSS